MAGLHHADSPRRHAVAMPRGGNADQARWIELKRIEIMPFGTCGHRSRALAGREADHAALGHGTQVLRQHDVGVRGGDCGVEDRAQKRASVGHGIGWGRTRGHAGVLIHPPSPKENPRKGPSRGGGVPDFLSDDRLRQPPTSELMISPNLSQVSPLKRMSCICEIGAKSVGLVLIFTPGNRPTTTRLCRFAACFMMLARVRSLPHCFST